MNLIPYDMKLTKAKKEMMYRIEKVFLSIAVVMLMYSCSSSRMLVSSVRPYEISELAYFEPQSYIWYIKKGNKAEYSDSLSSITEERIDSSLSLFHNELHISEAIYIEDSILNKKVEDEINTMIQIIIRDQQIGNLQLLPLVDSVMEAHGQRFALAVVANGFGRRAGNYAGQVAKGVGVGLLTLGMYVPTPVKSKISLYGVIFDSQKNEVSFYRRTRPVEKEPAEQAVIDSQVRKLFDGYFFVNNTTY
jgi:hypothetical protein